MTKEQAMQAAKQAVYDATEIFETLDKEGRLRAPGRQVREELSEHVAEFVADNWVSFDGNPSKRELADAVESDEANDAGSGDATTGDETSGDAPDTDTTRPSLDSAVIAADERKRLDAETDFAGVEGGESTDGSS